MMPEPGLIEPAPMGVLLQVEPGEGNGQYPAQQGTILHPPLTESCAVPLDDPIASET